MSDPLHLPDCATVTIPVGELRAMLAAARHGQEDGPAWVTCRQAARIVGMHKQYWSTLARNGSVPGARRLEGTSRTWLLPLAACFDHLARLPKGKANRKEWVPRGPYQTGTTEEAA